MKPDGFSGHDYSPTTWVGRNFTIRQETGFEREIAKRLEYWAKLRAKRGMVIEAPYLAS